MWLQRRASSPASVQPGQGPYHHPRSCRVHRPLHWQKGHLSLSRIRESLPIVRGGPQRARGRAAAMLLGPPHLTRCRPGPGTRSFPLGRAPYFSFQDTGGHFLWAQLTEAPSTFPSFNVPALQALKPTLCCPRNGRSREEGLLQTVRKQTVREEEKGGRKEPAPLHGPGHSAYRGQGGSSYPAPSGATGEGRGDGSRAAAPGLCAGLFRRAGGPLALALPGPRLLAPFPCSITNGCRLPGRTLLGPQLSPGTFSKAALHPRILKKIPQRVLGPLPQRWAPLQGRPGQPGGTT